MTRITRQAGPSSRQLSKIEALGAIPLFSRLSDQQLDAIAEATGEHRVDAGTQLMAPGDVASHLSILVTGAAVMTVDGEPVATLGPGDVLGEFALLDESPMTTGVTTTEETSLWRVARAQFREIAEQRPDLASAMLDGLVARLRETNISLASLRRPKAAG